jgi:hypothetical protein
MAVHTDRKAILSDILSGMVTDPNNKTNVKENMVEIIKSRLVLDCTPRY